MAPLSLNHVVYQLMSSSLISVFGNRSFWISDSLMLPDMIDSIDAETDSSSPFPSVIWSSSNCRDSLLKLPFQILKGFWSLSLIISQPNQGEEGSKSCCVSKWRILCLRMSVWRGSFAPGNIFEDLVIWGMSFREMGVSV